jgi:hypothetical protein
MEWTQHGSKFVGTDGWEIRRDGEAFTAVCTAGEFRWLGRYRSAAVAQRAVSTQVLDDFLQSTVGLESCEPDGGFPDLTAAMDEIMGRLVRCRTTAQ